MRAKCVLFALALLAVSTVEAIQAMGKPKPAVNARRPRSPSEVVRRRTQYTQQSWKDSSENGFFRKKAIAREKAADKKKRENKTWRCQAVRLPDWREDLSRFLKEKLARLNGPGQQPAGVHYACPRMQQQQMDYTRALPNVDDEDDLYDDPDETDQVLPSQILPQPTVSLPDAAKKELDEFHETRLQDYIAFLRSGINGKRELDEQSSCNADVESHRSVNEEAKVEELSDKEKSSDSEDAGDGVNEEELADTFQRRCSLVKKQ